MQAHAGAAGRAPWWEMVSFSGFRSLLARLSPAQREVFEAGHLAEVRSLQTDQEIWLNVETLFARARKAD